MILGGKRDMNDNDWFSGEVAESRTCDVFINFDDDTLPDDVQVSSYSSYLSFMDGREYFTKKR